MLSLGIDPVIVVDSIRWQFLYWPKKPLPAIAAPQCNDQRTCSFKPTASGGHAQAIVYSFAGNLFLDSQEIYAINRCATDPPLADDTLLQSPVVRASLIALLDSAWADSAAGKRRERQAYFYRDSSDHAPVPNVFVFWALDSVPATPCHSMVKKVPGGKEFTLMGFGHSHPFTQNESYPVECGPDYYDNGNGKYKRRPSTWDQQSQERLKVPGYALDKASVNKFRRKSFWKRESKFYDWNTSACHW